MSRVPPRPCGRIRRRSAGPSGLLEQVAALLPRRAAPVQGRTALACVGRYRGIDGLDPRHSAGWCVLARGSDTAALCLCWYLAGPTNRDTTPPQAKATGKRSSCNGQATGPVASALVLSARFPALAGRTELSLRHQ